ncbi:MAG TPA: hypothetical protein VLT36_23190 [Candidatus Dormibacteraeota bacterium]|nr:hypothetical protein [Candidatus Dormibacteraeota bacterium]
MAHAGDEMDVVGHDDEAAAEPTVAGGRIEEEGDEAFKGGFVVEDATATVHAGSEEIGDVAVAIGPDTVKATETAGWGVAR